MTEFYIAPADLEKWIYQNDASYTGMFVEGCLLDSFVLECRRGFAFVYEHFLNTWSSNYRVVFIPYRIGKRPEFDRAFAEWFEFASKARTA